MLDARLPKKERANNTQSDCIWRWALAVNFKLSDAENEGFSSA